MISVKGHTRIDKRTSRASFGEIALVAGLLFLVGVAAVVAMASETADGYIFFSNLFHSLFG